MEEVGLLNLAKNKPVANAKVSKPAKAFREAMILAPIPIGPILPYPRVVNVCTLKKKQWYNSSTNVLG